MDKIQMAKGKLARGPLPAMFNSEHYRQVADFHQTLKQYAPTPLINLSKLAEKLGIQAIFVKDESHRFGLNAFKALGASYAAVSYTHLDVYKRQPIESGCRHACLRIVDFSLSAERLKFRVKQGQTSGQ